MSYMSRSANNSQQKLNKKFPFLKFWYFQYEPLALDWPRHDPNCSPAIVLDICLSNDEIDNLVFLSFFDKKNKQYHLFLYFSAKQKLNTIYGFLFILTIYITLQNKQKKNKKKTMYWFYSSKIRVAHFLYY